MCTNNNKQHNFESDIGVVEEDIFKLRRRIRCQVHDYEARGQITLDCRSQGLKKFIACNNFVLQVSLDYISFPEWHPKDYLEHVLHHYVEDVEGIN